MTERAHDLFRSSVTVSGLQLGGKLLAMAKTLMLAAAFGTAGGLDAFWVAYSLPTLLPSLLGNLITTAFIPQFMKRIRDHTTAEAWAGASALFSLMMILVAGFTAVLAAMPGAFIDVMAPGLPAPVRALAIGLLRTMSLASVFMMANAILAAVSYARERYVVPVLEGLTTNVVLIIGIVGFAPGLGITSLGPCVVVGFGLQTLFLALANRRLILSAIRPTLDVRHEDCVAPLRHMVPLVVGYLAAVATGIVTQIYASYLDAGSISAMQYASMIVFLPLEIFAQALYTTFYPALSRESACGALDRLGALAVKGLRWVILALVPSAAVLAVFAAALVRLLLERGEFSAASTALTAGAITALALGLVTRGVAFFNYRTLNAVGAPWTQVAIGLGGVVANIVLNTLLVKPLGLIGIALGTSLAQTLAALVSTHVVGRRIGSSLLPRLREPVWKVAVMTAGGVLVAWLLRQGGAAVLDSPPVLYEVAVLAPALVAGALVFVSIGLAVHLEEATAAARFVLARLSPAPRRAAR